MPTALELRHAQSRAALGRPRRGDDLLLRLDAGEITPADFERLTAEQEGQAQRVAGQRTTGILTAEMYAQSWEHDERVMAASREVCGWRMSASQEAAIRDEVRAEYAARAMDRHQRQATGLGGPQAPAYPLDPDLRAVRGGQPHPDALRNSTRVPQMPHPLAPPALPIRTTPAPLDFSGAPHHSPGSQSAIGRDIAPALPPDLRATGSLPLPEER